MQGIPARLLLENGLDQAIAAETFQPMDDASLNALRPKTAQDGSRGAFELYKTSSATMAQPGT